MKKQWKQPVLEVLDIKETMLGWKHNSVDLIFEGFSDDHGWIPNPGGGGGGENPSDPTS